MKKTSWLLLSLLILTACGKKKPTFQLDPPVPAKAILYHLNVRDFSPEGTFKGMQNRLPELKNLGINTIILAPIQPIGLKNRQGNAGSLYATADFKGIHPDLGTTSDFHELLDSCHASGLYVILEWDATSTAADHPWLSSHPSWYINDSLSYPINPNSATAKLNLGDSLLLQELSEQMNYWVDTMGIDGFYASSAEAFPKQWWSKTISRLEETKPLLLLAKYIDNSVVASGFDLISNELLGQQLEKLLNKSSEMPVFTSMPLGINTIIARDSLGSLRLPVFHYGNRKAALIAALMPIILPGQPIIYGGEEVGHASPLLATEKNFILWGANADIRNFYSSLLQLRNNQEAFQSDFMTQVSLNNSQLLLIRRGNGLGTVHCLINPTDSLANLHVPLDLQGKRFTDCFTGRSVLLEKELLMLEYSFYLLKADAAS